MSNFFERAFQLKARKSNLKTEILAGLITFIAMVYILPVNAGILGTSGLGMNDQGVFAATALVAAACCLIMGIIANVPMVLAAGMGMNAFIAYTVGGAMGFSWNECMILLLVSGIFFFVLSVTPVRQYMMRKFPKDIKLIISAGLGAFICFVGLSNGGIVVTGAGTPVALGSFTNPGTIIALVGIILVLGFMFSKVKFLSKFAIPLVLVAAAIATTTASTILFNFGDTSSGTLLNMGLFWAPWDGAPMDWNPLVGLREVMFFGFIAETPPSDSFATMLANVFSNPISYVAIFSLTFVNLFDTTATLLTLTKKIGVLDPETGKMERGGRIILADAIGSVICAPLGTSTTTTFAESSVGIEMGARTGIAAITSGLMFLVAIFVYPLFSFFSPGCVTAPALVTVGALIFVENLKEINWKDIIVPITGFITIMMMVLTYSLANGLGIGLIAYVVMMLFAKRHKELNVVLYVLASIFLISFTLNTVLESIN